MMKYIKFKGLTPAVFLSTDEDSKKKRKQTLGQILDVVNKELSFCYDGLDEYLEMRNTFIHNFWREYYSRKTRDECIRFLDKFGQQTNEWNKYFTGFLYIVIDSKEDEDVKILTEEKLSMSERDQLKAFFYIRTLYKMNK